MLRKILLLCTLLSANVQAAEDIRDQREYEFWLASCISQAPRYVSGGPDYYVICEELAKQKMIDIRKPSINYGF